jgi:pyridoxine 5-phosphate synthase
MAHLSVNLNKIALLRNSRGKNFPAPEEFGKKALEAGAFGLTLHPRPDQRHARYSDLPLLGELIHSFKKTRPAELNVEGYPSEEFLSRVLEQQPDQCTLVPDAPDAITSNAGWDFVTHQEFLTHVIRPLKSKKIRVSLFLDPFTFTPAQKKALQTIAPERIELYTEKYAQDFGTPHQAATLEAYKNVSTQISLMGIEINAGHDLNQKNLRTLLEEIPQIKEVSIGHALIVDALWEGFIPTLKNYLALTKAP